MNIVILLNVILDLLLVLLGWALSRSALRDIARIRRTPTGVIGALPMEGQAEVVGKAGQAVSTSPFTQTACVFWQIQVEEMRSSGRSSHWATIYLDSSREQFDVSDGTGEVHVDPAGAELLLRNELKKSSGFLNHMDPQIKEKVESLGIRTTGVLGWEKSLRVQERLITADEPLYILGEIDRSSGRAVLESQPQAPLVISDRSERAVLGSLYWQVVLRFGLVVVLGIFFVWGFISGLTQPH